MSVRITSGDKQLILIYGETVLPLSKSDTLEFRVNYNHPKGEFSIQFVFVFIFDDNGEAYTSHVNSLPGIDGQTIGMAWILHKWYSPTFVEVIDPVPIDFSDSNGLTRRMYLKFRTQANEKQAHREFTISVWLEDAHG